MCGAGLGAILGGILGAFYGMLPHTSLSSYASTLNTSGRSGSMICVIMASTLGIIGGVILGGYYGYRKPNQVINFAIQKKIETFWLCWALLLVYLTWNGAFSMLQPAADIFVAGFTQVGIFISISILLVLFAPLLVLLTIQFQHISTITTNIYIYILHFFKILLKKGLFHHVFSRNHVCEH
jgi:hypothetical protein